MWDVIVLVLDHCLSIYLNGGFLLLWIFSIANDVGPHVCFILDLILVFMFLR